MEDIGSVWSQFRAWKYKATQSKGRREWDGISGAFLPLSKHAPESLHGLHLRQPPFHEDGSEKKMQIQLPVTSTVNAKTN